MDKPQTTSGMTAYQAKECFPEWYAVKKKIWNQYNNQHDWFRGVGIGLHGVQVYVNDEEDRARIPTEIDGVRIFVVVIGEIIAL
jgi:hypothetical protein